MASPVVHFEVVGRDGAALQSFYGDLFGWKIDVDNEMNYGIVDNEGKGINGGVGGTMPEGDPHVTWYVAVSDINATLEKAEQMGGKTVLPRQELPMVTLALFNDPEGNLIGLVEDGSM
jgi:predicted enzyme related to lactoylglutathione lyase